MSVELPPVTNKELLDNNCSKGVPLYETVPTNVCTPSLITLIVTGANVPEAPFFIIRIDVGATVIVGGAPCGWPVPDSATVDGLSGALYVTVSDEV